MGNRQLNKLYDWQSIWYGRGQGRYWKRQLSKARRRYAKMLIWFGRGKEPTHYESECNWKGS